MVRVGRRLGRPPFWLGADLQHACSHPGRIRRTRGAGCRSARYFGRCFVGAGQSQPPPASGHGQHHRGGHRFLRLPRQQTGLYPQRPARPHDYRVAPQRGRLGRGHRFSGGGVGSRALPATVASPRRPVGDGRASPAGHGRSPRRRARLGRHRVRSVCGAPGPANPPRGGGGGRHRTDGGASGGGRRYVVVCAGMGHRRPNGVDAREQHRHVYRF